MVHSLSSTVAQLEEEEGQNSSLTHLGSFWWEEAENCVCRGARVCSGTASSSLPRVCIASSLCCTCWAIILLIPMRLSVMVLEVCARLSLVVFLQVQRKEQ